MAPSLPVEPSSQRINWYENRLAGQWTAIEYLVRGKGSKQIGATVEHGLAPVLCLVYPAKLLLDVRQTLVKAGTELIDPVTGNPVSLKDVSVLALYQTLCRAHI